jgi:hypothetical protein
MVANTHLVTLNLDIAAALHLLRIARRGVRDDRDLEVVELVASAVDARTERRRIGGRR